MTAFTESQRQHLRLASAELAGEVACRNGWLALDENPHCEDAMREAWARGWRAADDGDR